MTLEVLGLYISTVAPADPQEAFKRGYWRAFADIGQYLPSEGPLSRNEVQSPQALGLTLSILSHELWEHQTMCPGRKEAVPRLEAQVEKLTEHLRRYSDPPPEARRLLAEKAALWEERNTLHARAIKAEEKVVQLTAELNELSAFVVQHQEALKAAGPKKAAK